MSKLLLALPKELHKELKLKAVEQDTSVTAIIIKAIKEALEREGEKFE